MSFQEKSAWIVIGTLVLASGWYAVTVAQRVGSAGPDQTQYADLAAWTAVGVVILISALHIVLAIWSRPGKAAPTTATRRQPGSAILAAGAVIAVALTLIGAPGFWIANVLIATLVAGEIALAATRIAAELRLARDA